MPASPSPASAPVYGDDSVHVVEGSVFAALFDAADAAHLAARADVMNALRARVAAAGWTQATAARHLGTTQARVSALTRGRFADFSLDALVTMATRAGLRVRVSVEGDMDGGTAHSPADAVATRGKARTRGRATARTAA